MLKLKLQTTVKSGIKSVVLDVESMWYVANKPNIDDFYYELLDYAENKTKEFNMKDVEFYDRATHMKSHREEYKRIRENAQSDS